LITKGQNKAGTKPAQGETYLKWGEVKKTMAFRQAGVPVGARGIL